MREISVPDVHRVSVEILGLDVDCLDLTSVETVAASLRRAASFLCPCSFRTLVNAVVEPLQGMIEDMGQFRIIVEDTLEGLVAYGDLLELEELTADDSPEGRTLLYCAPPCFVARESGNLILVGVCADNLSFLPREIDERIEFNGHIRNLHTEGTETLDRLKELGYLELKMNSWLKAPTAVDYGKYLADLNQRLQHSNSGGHLPGLLIIDPASSVRYYRGRWVEATSETGCFVGRRPQAYGADIWCYAELSEGEMRKVLDFPQPNSKWRGCDDAWLAQAAIDREREAPQEFRVRQGPHGMKILDFFSPVPMWARRRWDALGEPVPASKSLFSYRFKEEEVREEITFITERLWLRESNA